MEVIADFVKRKVVSMPASEGGFFFGPFLPGRCLVIVVVKGCPWRFLLLEFSFFYILRCHFFVSRSIDCTLCLPNLQGCRCPWYGYGKAE
jgi:hypothetical protein